MNCMVILSESLAVRADQVVAVKAGMSRTEVQMENGVIWLVSVPVKDAVSAINLSLNAARTTLNPEGDGAKPD